MKKLLIIFTTLFLVFESIPFQKISIAQNNSMPINMGTYTRFKNFSSTQSKFESDSEYYNRIQSRMKNMNEIYSFTYYAKSGDYDANRGLLKIQFHFEYEYIYKIGQALSLFPFRHDLISSKTENTTCYNGYGMEFKYKTRLETYAKYMVAVPNLKNYLNYSYEFSMPPGRARSFFVNEKFNPKSVALNVTAKPEFPLYYSTSKKIGNPCSTQYITEDRHIIVLSAMNFEIYDFINGLPLIPNKIN